MIQLFTFDHFSTDDKHSKHGRERKFFTLKSINIICLVGVYDTKFYLVKTHIVSTIQTKQTHSFKHCLYGALSNFIFI